MNNQNQLPRHYRYLVKHNLKLMYFKLICQNEYILYEDVTILKPCYLYFKNVVFIDLQKV